ncbi:hypothetical protein HGB07_01240 [Candidatus Roizmanbacteria bacterium]|nr:hypothetical protein [Candidatus Roizmanbacteria bacterium]
MNNKVIVPALVVLTIVGIGVFGATQTSAQTNSGFTSLVEQIATKFGLKQSDVQAVFDQHRQDRQTQMETQFEAKLSQDVKDGKITEAQKQLIIAKHKELAVNRQKYKESLKSMTADQRKTTREKEKNDLETWAKQNNIDLKYLYGGLGNGFGRGHGMK